MTLTAATPTGTGRSSAVRVTAGTRARADRPEQTSAAVLMARLGVEVGVGPGLQRTDRDLSTRPDVGQPVRRRGPPGPSRSRSSPPRMTDGQEKPVELLHPPVLIINLGLTPLSVFPIIFRYGGPAEPARATRRNSRSSGVRRRPGGKRPRSPCDRRALLTTISYHCEVWKLPPAAP